jgi:hypothetical protein
VLVLTIDFETAAGQFLAVDVQIGVHMNLTLMCGSVAHPATDDLVLPRIVLISCAIDDPDAWRWCSCGGVSGAIECSLVPCPPEKMAPRSESR